MIELHQHQLELVEGIRDSLRVNQSVVARAPCGYGKTVLASYIAQSMQERGKRLIFTVHRRHLIRQTALTFQQFGIDFGVISGGERNHNPLALVQVASMATLKNRLESYQADLVIADECHLSASDGHLAVLNHYKEAGARLLGLSATPVRLDGKPLGDIYSDIVFGRDEAWLIERGYLSQYEVICPTVPKLDSVGQSMGDYDKIALAAAMDNVDLAGNMIDSWRQHANGMRTIGYGVNRAHSRNMAAAFTEAGIPAEHIDGDTPHADMNAAIERLAARDTKILFNCMLMVEGFDLSAQIGHDVPIEALIKARPTQSVALNGQMDGRAMRRKPQPAIILDHAGNYMRHGLPDWPRDWSLEGKTKRKKTELTIPIKRCTACMMPFRPAPFCPHCGHVVETTARELDHDESIAMGKLDKEAALAEFKRNRKREESEARTLEQLIALGRSRGYAPGWAMVRWKARGMR